MYIKIYLDVNILLAYRDALSLPPQAMPGSPTHLIVHDISFMSTKSRSGGRSSLHVHVSPFFKVIVLL